MVGVSSFESWVWPYSSFTCVLWHCATKTSPFWYFDAVVSPVACFAAGHRAVHQGDLNRLDVDFRKHLRQLVGLAGVRPLLDEELLQR